MRMVVAISAAKKTPVAITIDPKVKKAVTLRHRGVRANLACSSLSSWFFNCCMRPLIDSLGFQLG